ncbi:MAG: glutathione S-transferase family protein [Candidatus Binatia bacterium]
MPTVLGASASPFVRKVRVVLAEKGIAYDHKPVRPRSTNPEFRKVSPLGKIPAFVDGDFAICDSSVICAYLERVHPAPAMYPHPPKDFARALWYEEYGDTVLAQGATFGTFGRKIVAPLSGQPVDEAAIRKTVEEELPPVFDWLEGEVGTREFLVGERFSIADVSIATHFVNFRHAGFDVDAARWPRLASWVTHHLARPIFVQLAAEDRQALGLPG